MMWRPRHLTRSQREERRLEAGRLLQAGQLSRADMARRLGVSRRAVSTWARQLHQHQGDMASLRARPIPGRPARLSAAQWQHVLAVVLVAFGVHHHAHCLARRLKALGWSPQQPAVYARERDEALVQAWLAQDWPRIKKRLAGDRRKSSSWMKPAFHSAPTARPPARRWGKPPSCGVSASAGYSRRPSGSRCLAAST